MLNSRRKYQKENKITKKKMKRNSCEHPTDFFQILLLLNKRKWVNSSHWMWKILNLTFVQPFSVQPVFFLTRAELNRKLELDIFHISWFFFSSFPYSFLFSCISFNSWNLQVILKFNFFLRFKDRANTTKCARTFWLLVISWDFHLGYQWDFLLVFITQFFLFISHMKR